MTDTTSRPVADMRAAVLHGPRDLRIERRAVPEPGAGEVLVRVRRVGVCGSDIHFFEDGRAGSCVVREPVVLGHEFGGVIAAVGPGVGDRVGERVSVEPGIQCGLCAACRRGAYNHCTGMRFLGAAPADGALQEFVVVPADHTFAVPETLSDEAAALVEPLSVAIWGVARARPRASDAILIIGAGSIGVLCALVADTTGPSSVVLVDPNEQRRERAAQLTGATAIPPGDVVALSRSFDVVLECSGSASGLASALASVREGGQVVIIGVGVDRLDVAMNVIQEGEVSLSGSHRYRDTWPEAISMITRGDLDPAQLVTAHFPLEQAAAAISDARTNPASLKVCIDVAL